jgi:ring-1,2-phenylacetyl-CoA epoxidase subunit PaaD
MTARQDGWVTTTGPDLEHREQEQIEAGGPSADLQHRARPRPTAPTERAVWDLAATVHDPEVPVLTVEDLGVLRGVRISPDGTVTVQITPTYTGCPAVDAMRADIGTVLAKHGYTQVRVDVVLSPAWTTDWISAEGRTKLEAYGIAPPATATGPVLVEVGVRCPHCGSLHTREVARFGSTACKALYVCQRCREPFDYFKPY